MSLRYEITTGVDKYGRITQIVETVSDLAHETVRDTVLRQVLDTCDAQVRDALIGMGWTPPT